jgi:hypothetical protein
VYQLRIVMLVDEATIVMSFLKLRDCQRDSYEHS